MKKSIVGAVIALAMSVVGVAPAAYATVPASNSGAFQGEYFNESGPINTASLVVGAGANQASITMNMVPNASAWAAIQNGTRVIAGGGSPTKDGAAIVSNANTRANFNVSMDSSTGSFISANYGVNNTQSFVVPASASVGSAKLRVSMSMYRTGMNMQGTIDAGTYAFTPSLTIDGVDVNLSDYTITYSYSIMYRQSFTAAAATTYVNKSGSVCVDTTGYSAGDVLTMTATSNGVAGYSGSDNITSRIGKAQAPGSMSGNSLASLASSTGVYTYTLTANEINSLLIVYTSAWGQRNQSGAETVDTSVAKGGVEVTVPCYASTPATPVVTNTGTTTSFTVSSVGIPAHAALYETRCYGDPTVFGPGSMPLMPTTPVNGVCTFNNTSAATTYNFFYRASLQGGGVYAGSLSSASVQSVGAVGVAQQVVAPQAPAIVFNQPKFEIPAKIAISASGKVSLSGKDMGVTSVVVGGKEQKIDVNSTTKLDFDTTGLTAGVHDLVMKGAFGTYTVQKAIQVGTPVATKVYGLSARTVSMAGGELSINGVGLEGATQITMNGQILEIVSKTDTKVTFKVPASTLATKNNSILIAGSFLPVLFKNAVTYTN
jgi:hypothetical protein